jgi:hypothetical protein
MVRIIGFHLSDGESPTLVTFGGRLAKIVQADHGVLVVKSPPGVGSGVLLRIRTDGQASQDDDRFGINYEGA